MVYRHPGPHKIHGNLFDYKIVEGELREGEDASDLDKALADGWYLTTPEALESVLDDPENPTREELEAKATELGLKFTSRTSDKKLASEIEAALES